MLILIVVVFQPGGPAIFVLSWAIIKAFAIETKNLSIDGVSIIIITGSICLQKNARINVNECEWKLFITLAFSLLLVDGGEISGTLLFKEQLVYKAQPISFTCYAFFVLFCSVLFSFSLICTLAFLFRRRLCL